MYRAFCTHAVFFLVWQCYDQYLLKSLQKSAEAKGHSFWARGPDNAGSYSSQPHETEFFSNGGDYDGYYGRFFLSWYSRVLIEHSDRVLSLAKLSFEETCIAAKVSCLYWSFWVLGYLCEPWLWNGNTSLSNSDIHLYSLRIKILVPLSNCTFFKGDKTRKKKRNATIKCKHWMHYFL